MLTSARSRNRSEYGFCIASQGNYDLVSFMVKLHCESLAEKLVIPAFVYFFFMLYPPAWIRDPRRSTAGAAGGCMLVRSETLERAGGLEAYSRCADR